MNRLSTLRTRRLARPHLLALAAVLALPATVGAQATNSWRCAGGGWNGDTVCWSLGRTPIASDNIVIPAGPTGSDLMLLHAIGNTVSMRQLTIGDTRTEPSTSATAYLYASGSTINVTGSTFESGNVNIGNANNANAQLSLTNSTLNLINNPAVTFPGEINVGSQGSFTPGFGALSLQANARINGAVNVFNGRIDVAGSTNAAYNAVSGGVAVYGNSQAHIAGGLNSLVVSGGRAVVGTTGANLATPVLTNVQTANAGALDFVGRSRVGFLFMPGGVTTVRTGASVESKLDNNSGMRLFSGAQLVLESGGQVRTETALNEGSIQMIGGTINHTGIDNRGTVSGAGLIDSVLETQAFKQQSSGLVRASGGDLVIWGAFDGKAGGALDTAANSRLVFNGNADFKAGQVITQSGPGGSALFRFNVNIGNASERGSLEAMTANLVMQNSSHLFLDFGSLGVGDHDYLYTAGQIGLEGGALTLRTVPGAQFGQGFSFNILRATSGITGNFSSINFGSFALAPGARLDFSNLYTTGTVAVVPEPATWLSLGAGLLLISARARRWRQEA